MNRDLNLTCSLGLTCKPAFSWSPPSHPIQTPNPGPMTYLPFSPVLPLHHSLIFYPSPGTVHSAAMGTAADWASNPDEADSLCIDWAAGFLLFSLRSCASGLISCCRPPLSPSLCFSQSKESFNSNFSACVFHVCVDVYVHVCTKAWI